jgi:hypothetical protein
MKTITQWWEDLNADAPAEWIGDIPDNVTIYFGTKKGTMTTPKFQVKYEPDKGELHVRLLTNDVLRIVPISMNRIELESIPKRR